MHEVVSLGLVLLISITQNPVDSLRDAIVARIAASSGAVVAVSYRDLRSGDACGPMRLRGLDLAR